MAASTQRVLCRDLKARVRAVHDRTAGATLRGDAGLRRLGSARMRAPNPRWKTGWMVGVENSCAARSRVGSHGSRSARPRRLSRHCDVGDVAAVSCESRGAWCAPVFALPELRVPIPRLAYTN